MVRTAERRQWRDEVVGEVLTELESICTRILSSISEQSILLKKMAKQQQRRRQQKDGQGEGIGGEEGLGRSASASSLSPVFTDEEKVLLQLYLDVVHLGECMRDLGIADPKLVKGYVVLLNIVKGGEEVKAKLARQ